MTLWEIMVGYPGSQDINQHPYYPYRLAKLAWHVYHHSFTKNGRWFLAGTVIANLSFTMFWSFDIQTWILASAVNCIWIPDFLAKLLPLSDTFTLAGNVCMEPGQSITVSGDASRLSPNSVVHFERLPLALTSSHDEGFPIIDDDIVALGLIAKYRGRWSVPAIRVCRPGPFALIARSKVIPANLQIVVLPRKPDHSSIQTANVICSEILAAQQAAGYTQSTGMDFIRTHAPGDPINKIDWRASSRATATSQPTLQVRVSNPTSTGGIHIVVDERVLIAPVTKWQHWSGRGVREPLPIPEFEALISVAYASALALLKDGRSIASISSQRNSFIKLRTQDDIAIAFASLSHIETPTERLNHVPLPAIPDDAAIVFTLLPSQFESVKDVKNRQSIYLIADPQGIVDRTDQREE
jgi:hypothetical protein